MTTTERVILVAGMSPVAITLEAIVGPPCSYAVLGVFLLVATVLLVRRVDDDGAR